MEIIFLLIILLLIVLYKKKNVCEKYNNNNKIAFIFLTIGEIKQYKIWELFFKSAQNYNIYVHPKKPEEIQSFFKNHIIKNNIPTLWGDVSLVHATNLLIKEALKDETNKKIILVSDSCIPIKTYDYIYKAVFEDNKSWFNYYSPNILEGSTTHFNRIKSLDPYIKDYAYIHEQWMILDRQHAEVLNNNTHYMSYFVKDNLFPDEMYYITMLHLLNKNIKNELKFNKTTRLNYLKHDYITFAKWYDSKTKLLYMYHPYEFNKMNKEDVELLKNSKALFGRKFLKDSDIIDYWYYIINK
jgi:hypothetical protein